MRKAPLLFACFAGIVGIVAIDQERPLVWMGFGLVLLSLVFGLRYRDRPLAILLAGCVFAHFSFGWRHQQRLEQIQSFPLALTLGDGQTVEIGGEGWIADSPEYGDRSVVTSLQLRSVLVGGREIPCEHRLPCWIQKLPEGLAYGVPVRFTGRFVPLEGPEVPGGFDAREFYFRRSGSLASLEIREGDELELLPGREGSSLVRFARDLRGKLEAALLLGVPKSQEPHARLIAAMALGATEHSPEDLEEYFRISGTMHLFAVSGLNVAIVAGILAWIASVLGIPKSRAVPVIVPIVLFYAVLTGLSPSAVRAALMASIFLGGYAIREKPRLLNSLGLAALLLLAYDPQQLFLPGFQLSFAVLLFIALLTPVLTTHFAKPFLADPFLPRSLIRPMRQLMDRFTGALAASLAVSIASWFGSLGLLAWHFQSISPVGILANVFMVPLAGWIIGLAAISLTSYGLHLTWITLLANRLNVGVSILLTAMAQFFAGLPGATVHTGRERTAGAGTAVFRLDFMGERGEGAALLEIPSAGEGSAMFWMIDSGGTRTYQGRMLPLLRSRGINRIDALVLTHGDQGHLGSAVSVLNQFRPPLLLESAVENRSPAHREIAGTAGKLEVRTVTMDRGHRILLGDGAIMTVLHPSSLKPGRLADDRALVLRLEYAGHSILLTSDSGFDTEQALIDSGSDLRADLWVRGQHADAPSGTEAFVDAIRPRAVISTHSDFPESERISEALRKYLGDRGIPLYDLEASGTVSVEVDGKELRITPFAAPGESLVFPKRVSSEKGNF